MKSALIFLPKILISLSHGWTLTELVESLDPSKN